MSEAPGTGTSRALPEGALPGARPRSLPNGFQSWQPLKSGGGTLSQLTDELHQAAFTADVAKVRSILAAGGSTANKYRVNAEDLGSPPLVYAVRGKAADMAADANMAEVTRMLIDAGADIGYVTPGGESTLILASTYGGGVGKVQTVKVLLEARADLRHHDKRNKMTALHWAVVSGWSDVVETLIAAGASCTTVGGKERESAVQQARSRLVRFKQGQFTPTGPTTAEAQLEEYTKIAQACAAGEAARLQHKAAKKAAMRSGGGSVAEAAQLEAAEAAAVPRDAPADTGTGYASRHNWPTGVDSTCSSSFIDLD